MQAQVEDPAGVPRFLRTFLGFVAPVVEQFKMKDYMRWRNIVMDATMYFETPEDERPAEVPRATPHVPPPQPPPAATPQPYVLPPHVLHQRMLYNQAQAYSMNPYTTQQLPPGWRTPAPTAGLPQAVPATPMTRPPQHATPNIMDLSLTPFMTLQASHDDLQTTSTPKPPE